jgi:hypothetical protein
MGFPFAIAHQQCRKLTTTVSSYLRAFVVEQTTA